MNILWQKQTFQYFFTIASLYSAKPAKSPLINGKNILTPVIFYEPNVNACSVVHFYINNRSLIVAFMEKIICQSEGGEDTASCVCKIICCARKHAVP